MGTVDKKDYVIQALTQQRDAANNEIARIIAEANEQIDALKARIAELEEAGNITTIEPQDRRARAT
jgi:hypothetical protein